MDESQKTEPAGLGLCAPWYGTGNGAVGRVVVVVRVMVGLSTSLDLRVSHGFISLFIT
jgi:hypothetical protein